MSPKRQPAAAVMHKIEANSMEEIIQIHKLSLHRLNNALHTNFHLVVYQLISEMGAEKLGLPAALVAAYQACTEEATEMIKETRASLRTKALRKKDAACDRLMSFILAVVRAMRLSPRADEVEAAEDLYIQLRIGKRIQAEGISLKPGRIDALLHDLRKPKHAANITRLRLDEAVDLLEKTKEEMRTLMSDRSNELVEKDRPSLTRIRPKTDEVYGRLLRHLQVAYIAGQPPVDREAIGQIVRYINAYVDHTRMTHKQSLSHRKPRRKPTDAV